MKHANPRRLLFAAPASGSGKTTVVCAVMRALKKRRLTVQSFKSGPDYIDPMFHAAVTGVEAHNLDVFLFGGHGAGEQVCRRILAGAGERADISVLEGAMGYYDGLGLSEEYSAYELARLTGTPVVLIVDGKGTALSLATAMRAFTGLAGCASPYEKGSAVAARTSNPSRSICRSAAAANNSVLYRKFSTSSAVTNPRWRLSTEASPIYGRQPYPLRPDSCSHNAL